MKSKLNTQIIPLEKFVKLLFNSFPLILMFHSFLLNLWVLTFIISSATLIFIKKLKINFSTLNKIFIVFFTYIILVAVLNIKTTYINSWNDFVQFESINLYKSILLIKFFLIVLITNILLQNSIIKFKGLFICALVTISFVSFDVIFQYTFGVNIMGREMWDGRNTSIFYPEAIAGAYIQKFSIIAIFALYLLKVNYKKLKLLIPFIIIFLATGILLTHERMPFLLFIFSCCLIFIFVRKMRTMIISSLLLIGLIFSTLIKYDDSLRDKYVLFYLLGKNMITLQETTDKELKNELVKKRKKWLSNESSTNHLNVLLSAFDVWKIKPLTAHGIKSYRTLCHKNIEDKQNRKCSTHPHNYYLEILSELGLIGIILFTFILIFLIKNFIEIFLKNKVYKKNNLENLIFLSLLISMIVSLWPIKITGSIFTTWNGTYYWFLISLYASIQNNFKNKFI